MNIAEERHKQADWRPVSLEALERAIPNRLPGYKEAVIKAGVPMKDKNQVITGYLLTGQDFYDIKLKYNPKDRDGAIAAGAVINRVVKDVRTRMAQEALNEEVPFRILNTAQAKARRAYTAYLNGRSEAECKGCELTKVRTRIVKEMVEDFKKPAHNMTVVTLWSGRSYDALRWYKETTFPLPARVLWLDDSGDGVSIKEAINTLKGVKVKQSNAPEVVSKPARIGALYDQLLIGEDLGDLVLFVSDDIYAQQDALPALLSYMEDPDVGAVSALHSLVPYGANYTVDGKQWGVEKSDSDPVDITAGAATLGFTLFRKEIVAKALPLLGEGRDLNEGNDTILHRLRRELGYTAWVLPNIKVQHQGK